MRELPPLIIPGGSPQCLNSLAPLGRCQCVYQEHTFTFWARFSHLEDFARTVACVAYSFCGRTSKGFSTCASCPSSLLPLSKKARHPMYYPRIRGKYTWPFLIFVKILKATAGNWTNAAWARNEPQHAFLCLPAKTMTWIEAQQTGFFLKTRTVQGLTQS